MANSPTTAILSHPNTDFDAFAAMLAAQLLYPGAQLCLHAGVNRNVREFFNLHSEQIPHVEASALPDLEIERAVLIEIDSTDRLGALSALCDRPDVEVTRFQHQPGAQAPEATGRLVVGTEGSLVTTMLQLVLDRGAVVTPMHATAFALGIHEDTGSLTFPAATQRDAEALGWCLGAGANQMMLGRYLRAPLTEQQRQLLEVLKRAAVRVDLAGLTAVTTAVTATEYVEDISGLVSRVGEFIDWDVLFMCVSMEGRTQIVGRSRSESLEIDAVLEPLGGGGHPQAGSGVIADADPQAVLERVLKSARRVVKAPTTAAEVMSQPLERIGVSTSIADAVVELERLGLTTIQLEDEGFLIGSVAREDLDRALHHELGHAPVKGVMSAGVPIVGQPATLGELRSLLAGGRASRIVVVEAGEYETVERLPVERALGVVMPRHVLHALHEDQELHEPQASDSASKELRVRIGEIPRLEAILPSIQRVAAHYDGVYLVGGAVRDVLLGEPSLDLDLMVEGDAIAFAKELAVGLEAHCHPHEKFQTAVVKGRADDGSELRVDIATARSEFYSAPGALPEVERATLRQDLARRDFTINAMAASLKSDDFGSVFDFYGGYRDLHSGTIRVLHNLSFIEDPTRIFRALRYEARLSFEMDAHTVSLVRGCLRMGLLGDLSSTRLRDELLAILGEQWVVPALERIHALSLAEAIHHGLRADAETQDLVERLDSLVKGAAWGPEVRIDLLRLACMARELSADAIYAWLAQLRFKRDDQEVVARAVSIAPRIVGVLTTANGLPAADLYHLLEAQPLEVAATALLFAAGDRHAVAAIESWLDRLRHVELDISGKDLIQAGLPESPALGRALEGTLDLKLNGLVEGAEQELAAAKELAQRGQ